MKLWLKRAGPALYPLADFVEEFEKLPRGTNLQVEIKQPRNLEHHRLYWVLCTRIAQGIGKDAEFVDWALKIETGHYDLYMTVGGNQVLRPRSISFEKMDQIAFRVFFEECTVVLYEKWGINPASVADILLPRGMGKL